MEKFVPYKKLSKKKKRELDAGRRTVWAVSPVTRKPANPKAYNRKKAQKRMDDPGSVLSLFPLPHRGGESKTVVQILARPEQIARDRSASLQRQEKRRGIPALFTIL